MRSMPSMSGQAKIEHAEIGRTVAQPRQRLAPGRGRDHLITLGGQAGLEQMAKRRLVIDHQDFGRMGRGHG